jgi:hypothetical protein
MIGFGFATLALANEGVRTELMPIVGTKPVRILAFRAAGATEREQAPPMPESVVRS